MYFSKLNPFARTKTPDERRSTWRVWGMVVIGCVPAAVVGILLDDWVKAIRSLENPAVRERVIIDGLSDVRRYSAHDLQQFEC